MNTHTSSSPKKARFAVPLYSNHVRTIDVKPKLCAWPGVVPQEAALPSSGKNVRSVYWNAPPPIGGSVSVETIVLLNVALSTYHMPNQSVAVSQAAPVGAPACRPARSCSRWRMAGVAGAGHRKASRDVNGNARGAERRLDDPGEALSVAGEVREVGVVVHGVAFVPAFEVVEDDGKHEHVGLRRDVVAHEAELLLAHRRTAVAVDGVAVVALLTALLVDRQQQAVTAGRRAGAASRGADRLEAAERRAAVTRGHVPVVALLGAFGLPVAARRRRAGRRAFAGPGAAVAAARGGRRADPALGDADRLALERAGGAAAVAVHGVAVVALLLARDLAVAAHGVAAVLAAGALPAALERAVGRATVAAVGVAVVAGLGAFDHAVATLYVVDAGLADRRARPVRLAHARARAAVAADVVPVVAVLDRLDHAVAADDLLVIDERAVEERELAGRAAVVAAGAAARTGEAERRAAARAACSRRLLTNLRASDGDDEREGPTKNELPAESHN